MIHQKALIEIDGKKYMSPKAAGDLWGMSSQKVTAHCETGRIVGATKDSGGHYIIPINTQKPLEKDVIRKILIALLAMKNRPGESFFDVAGSTELFDYLQNIGLLEGSDLQSATLTNKGMEIATSGEVVSLDWRNASIAILNILGSLASIWSIMPH